MNRISLLRNALNQNNNNDLMKKTEIEIINNGKVGIIYLNSPKDLNALSRQMKSELIFEVNKMLKSKSIKVI